MDSNAEGILTSKNINPTSVRLLVLDFLLNQDSAVSLTEIEKGLQPVDRITVYRSLKTFEEKGLVHSIDNGTGIPKYALCVEDCDANEHHDLHVHFYCNSCKDTFCLPDSTIPLISLPDGFNSEEMNLIVKGVCAKCQS